MRRRSQGGYSGGGRRRGAEDPVSHVKETVGEAAVSPAEAAVGSGAARRRNGVAVLPVEAAVAGGETRRERTFGRSATRGGRGGAESARTPEEAARRIR
jgi:hypothetical protein